MAAFLSLLCNYQLRMTGPETIMSGLLGGMIKNSAAPYRDISGGAACASGWKLPNAVTPQQDRVTACGWPLVHS